MKQFAVAMILLSCFTAPPSAASWQRTEWTLYLKTDGAPFEKKFEVTLNNTGALNVTENEPLKMPAPTTSKVVVNLSISETQAVYEQTLKALRGFEFPKETEKLADGTNLTLRLTIDRRSLAMQVFHLSTLEDELPEVAKLVRLLNKHLPKEHEIY